MTTTTIDFNAWAQTFESSAEWRRQKATEYPRDAARNLAAAKLLDGLADEFRERCVDPEIVERYEALGENDNVAHRLTEVENELVRQIGFGRHIEKADNFIQAVINEVRA